MFGVRTSVAPYGSESCHEKSSAMNRTMCGRVVADCAPAVTPSDAMTSMMIVSSRLMAIVLMVRLMGVNAYHVALRITRLLVLLFSRALDEPVEVGHVVGMGLRQVAPHLLDRVGIRTYKLDDVALISRAAGRELQLDQGGERDVAKFRPAGADG